MELILEYHDKVSPPANCTNGAKAGATVNVLAAFWTSDENLTAKLAGLGFPAKFASIKRTVETTVELEQERWSWARPGDAVSEIAFVKRQTSPTAFSFVELMYWEHNGTYYRWDFAQEIVEDQGDGRAAFGKVAEPNLSAEFLAGNYVGRSAIFAEFESNSVFRRYADSECLTEI